eukprot:197390-Rhodomonas_salina.2
MCIRDSFEEMLGEDELFGGKRVSIADIAAFHSLQMYEDVKPGSLLELGAEKLDAYRKRNMTPAALLPSRCCVRD